MPREWRGHVAEGFRFVESGDGVGFSEDGFKIYCWHARFGCDDEVDVRIWILDFDDAAVPGEWGGYDFIDEVHIGTHSAFGDSAIVCGELTGVGDGVAADFLGLIGHVLFDSELPAVGGAFVYRCTAWRI